jgi:hypothetical protein
MVNARSLPSTLPFLLFQQQDLLLLLLLLLPIHRQFSSGFSPIS